MVDLTLHGAGACRPARQRPSRAPRRRLAARFRPTRLGVRRYLPGGGRGGGARFVRDRPRAQLALRRGGRDRSRRRGDGGRGRRRCPRGPPGGFGGRRRHRPSFAPSWTPPRSRGSRRGSRTSGSRPPSRTRGGEPVRTPAPVPAQPFRVLCAHRVGPFGAERFNTLVERRLRALGLAPARDRFYPGRPVLVTRNDPRTGLSNGDTGVVVRDAHGRPRVWFPELQGEGGGPRLVSPARLPPHESFFALTVHRAQGSEYDEVAVVLGPADSRVATRELLLYRRHPRPPPRRRPRLRGERRRRRRARDGALLRPPRRPHPPERIRDRREDSEAALTAADRAWDAGHLDFTEMEAYLSRLLQERLEDP